MIRKTLYKALQNRLHERLGDEIKHIDLWNHNIEFIEQEEGWERPAVFIEFGELRWNSHLSVGGGIHSYSGEGSFSLHIVVDWGGGASEGNPYAEETLRMYELSTKIHQALLSLNGDGFSGITLNTTLSNHNHEDMVENIDVYSFQCEMELREDNEVE